MSGVFTRAATVVVSIRSRIAWSIILASVSAISFLSACSSTNLAPANASRSSASALPSTQPSTAPSASRESAQASTASPSTASAAMAPLAQEHLVGIGSATVITIHGRIVSVDRAKKLVTLEGHDGKEVTFHVYNPYNLAAAKAGEPFAAKFYEIVTIRKKRPGENIPEASVAEGIATATPGQIPGAVAGTRRELVVTIDAINRDGETVVIEGPDGRAETISVANPANLKYLQVGDHIVITLTNVVSVVLEKEPGA
jgi:hypothetical protein